MEKNHDMAIKAMIMPIDESRLSSEVTINLYRILQESLVNIVRHANTKTASVSLCEEGDEIVLDVKDEGCGIVEDKLSRRRHFGILGMIERANMSGGKFKIVTTPGKGTRIRVSVPIG
jgi:signal transduction histidine kinase